MWGSRDRIAEFVIRQEERIRAIARRKLPHGAQSAYGSEDVFATVVRRVDALAARGLLRAESEAQLWVLIRRVVELVSLQRARLVESTASRTGDDAAFWSGVSRDLRRCNDDTEALVLVFEMVMSMADATDRQIFLLRLRGVSHRVLAEQVGLSEEAVRQRWHQIRQSLRSRFAPEPRP